MAFNYERIRTNVAEKQIRDKGRAGTLIAPGEPTGPEWDPQPGAPVESPVLVLELSMGGQTRYIESLRPDTVIQQNDKIIMVSTETGAVPAVGHQFRDSLDNHTYQIVARTPLAPGPLVMLWKMVIRR